MNYSSRSQWALPITPVLSHTPTATVQSSEPIYPSTSVYVVRRGCCVGTGSVVASVVALRVFVGWTKKVSRWISDADPWIIDWSPFHLISCTVSYTEMNGSGTAAQLVTNGRILEDGSRDSLEHNFHFRNIDSCPLNYTFLLKSTLNAFRIQLKEQTLIPKNKLNPSSGGDSKQLFIALSFARPPQSPHTAHNVTKTNPIGCETKTRSVDVTTHGGERSPS